MELNRRGGGEGGRNEEEEAIRKIEGMTDTTGTIDTTNSKRTQLSQTKTEEAIEERAARAKALALKSNGRKFQRSRSASRTKP